MKGTCCSVQCNLVQENFLRLLMNRESNQEQSRLCSCVGPNASKHLTGALSWPAADKWITSCENNKLYTEAEKMSPHWWERINYLQPSKILHTKWSGVNINEAYVWVDAFVCVCRDRHTPHPTLSLLQGDSDSPASSRTVKENRVIRHKWRQQRGICQRCCQRQLPLNYRHRDKGGYWRLERKTQVNQDFVTGTCYCLCSVA